MFEQLDLQIQWCNSSEILIWWRSGGLISLFKISGELELIHPLSSYKQITFPKISEITVCCKDEISKSNRSNHLKF